MSWHKNTDNQTDGDAREAEAEVAKDESVYLTIQEGISPSEIAVWLLDCTVVASSNYLSV